MLANRKEKKAPGKPWRRWLGCWLCILPCFLPTVSYAQIEKSVWLEKAGVHQLHIAMSRELLFMVKVEDHFGIIVFSSPASLRNAFDLGDTPAFLQKRAWFRPSECLAETTCAQLYSDLQTGLQQEDEKQWVLYMRFDSPVQLRDSYMLAPQGRQRLWRAVFDIEAGSKPEQTPSSSSATSIVSPRPVAEKNFVVVIDPGHGGKDPGAISARGLQEKDVNLLAAGYLKAYLDAQPHIRAILTRERDVFLSLDARLEIARANRADLYLSLHADSHPDQKQRGAAVYILGGDHARDLVKDFKTSGDLKAYRDAFGAVPPEVEMILVDMARNASLQKSRQFADYMVARLEEVTLVQPFPVRRVSFRVLQTLVIPGLLLEMAFLSNPEDENLLRSVSHIKRIMRAASTSVADMAAAKKKAPLAP